MADQNWISEPEFLATLQKLANTLKSNRDILVHGHIRLRWILSLDLLRFGDEAFTIVREPVQLILSQVNYILTRLLNDPALRAVDTRAWAKVIGIDKITEDPSQEFVTELSRKILHDRRIVQPNILCTYLGNGDANSAAEQIAISDIEIASTAHYRQWLAERWGIASSTRRNASRPYLTKDNLNDSDRDQIADLVVEDRKLYDRIARRMAHTATPSIRGTELD
jgi:hypothetical protein